MSKTILSHSEYYTERGTFRRKTDLDDIKKIYVWLKNRNPFAVQSPTMFPLLRESVPLTQLTTGLIAFKHKSLEKKSQDVGQPCIRPVQIQTKECCETL